MKSKIFIFFLSIIAIPAYPQTQVSPSGEIADREVVVVKDRINTLGYAEPILEKAETQPVNEQTREFSYTLTPLDLELPAVKPTVSVQKIETLKLAREYPNFLKMGGGNHFSSLLEGYFHNGRSKTHSMGGGIKHLASSPNSENTSAKPFSDNSIYIFGKKYFDDFSFGGNAGYERNRVNILGSPFDDPKLKSLYAKGFKQIHQTISTGIFFRNTAIESPFRFTGELNFYHYLNESDAIENDFSFSASSLYKFSSYSSLSGNLYASTTSQENLNKQYRNLSFFAFEPLFRYKKEKADASLGLKLHHEATTNSNTGIYPNISLKYAIVEDALYLFTLANGGKEKKTLKSLASKNPFIDSYFLMNDTLSGNPDLTFLVSGGFEGNIKTNMEFRFGYEFGKYDKIYFFNANPGYFRYEISEVKYVSVQRFFGEAAYHFNHELRVGINIKTNQFDMNNSEMEPWHVPEIETGLNINYSIKSKIGIHSEISYLHNYPIPEKTVDRNFKKSSLMDLNLGLDYRFSSKFSVFITGYNLTNKNYTRYYGYPINGLTLIGGAGFSF